MDRWEYATLYRRYEITAPKGAAAPYRRAHVRFPDGSERLADEPTSVAVQELLNSVGAEGWELVGIETDSSPTASWGTYWLRRRIEPWA